MNPWNVKLTHELTESEMMDYVRHMEAEGVFYDQNEIDAFVESCVSAWERMRERGLSGSIGSEAYFNALQFHIGATHGWVGELTSCSPASEMHPMTVKVYPWMDEKHVRYLARMQIEEQIRP